MIARALLLDHIRTSARQTKRGLADAAEWHLRRRRHTRPRPSYAAVARQMGGTVEHGDGYAVVTFPAAGEARSYADWLRRVRRGVVEYRGGTCVGVRL